jgi:hypothetical protein
LLLALCALSSRFVVPAGYMPESGKIALSICSGKGAAGSVLIDTGKTQHKGEPGDEHTPCAFASSAAPLLSGAQPQLLATAILYVIAQGQLPDLPLPATEPDRLRPPLRGPPSA